MQNLSFVQSTVGTFATVSGTTNDEHPGTVSAVPAVNTSARVYMCMHTCVCADATIVRPPVCFSACALLYISLWVGLSVRQCLQQISPPVGFQPAGRPIRSRNPTHLSVPPFRPSAGPVCPPVCPSVRSSIFPHLQLPWHSQHRRCWLQAAVCVLVSSSAAAKHSLHATTHLRSTHIPAHNTGVRTQTHTCVHFRHTHWITSRCK